MEQFDYRKLRGKITEVFGTISNFAEAMGVSRQAIYNKLNNGAWNQTDIVKALKLLNISNAVEGSELFFTKANSKNETH